MNKPGIVPTSRMAQTFVALGMSLLLLGVLMLAFVDLAGGYDLQALIMLALGAVSVTAGMKNPALLQEGTAPAAGVVARSLLWSALLFLLCLALLGTTQVLKHWLPRGDLIQQTNVFLVYGLMVSLGLTIVLTLMWNVQTIGKEAGRVRKWVLIGGVAVILFWVVVWLGSRLHP